MAELLGALAGHGVAGGCGGGCQHAARRPTMVMEGEEESRGGQEHEGKDEGVPGVVWRP